MTMFSLYELMDEEKVYQKACMELASKRFWSLVEKLDLELSPNTSFDAPQWSMRVSLANLPDEAYEDIGRGVRAIASGYRDACEASNGSDQGSQQALASRAASFAMTRRRRCAPPRWRAAATGAPGSFGAGLPDRGLQPVIRTASMRSGVARPSSPASPAPTRPAPSMRKAW